MPRTAQCTAGPHAALPGRQARASPRRHTLRLPCRAQHAFDASAWLLSRCCGLVAELLVCVLYTAIPVRTCVVRCAPLPACCSVAPLSTPTSSTAKRLRHAAAVAVAAAGCLLLQPLALTEPAYARIPTEALLGSSSSYELTPERAAAQLGAFSGGGSRALGAAPPASRQPPPPSGPGRAALALQLLNGAREAVDQGQHDEALLLYSRLSSEYGDLALAEYGRIGKAMMLYQAGRTSDAILLLEDEESAMLGSAEVHASLAALLYTERPTLALRAEEEWDIACAFDRRYSDVSWVRANKHWPPAMLAALSHFLSLSK